MIRHTSVVILFGLLARPAWSQTPKNQICVSAVQQAYSTLEFEGPGYGSYYVTSCLNPMRIASIYVSSRRYCKPDEIVPGFEGLNDVCETYGGFSILPESAVAANLTDEAIARMPVLDMDEVSAVENVTAPFIISRSWFDLSFRTTDTWEYELRTHTIYGWAIYAFWGGILLIGMLHRLWQMWFHSRLTPSTTDIEGESPSAGRKASPPTGVLAPLSHSYDWVQTNLILPSALGSYHARLWWWCTIPTRMQSLVIAAFWIISIVLWCVNYIGFEGNLYWPDVPSQIWRYIADRTGIYSYAALPWLWMFSGRNNIFIWATGWQFSTFNLFHRHIARAATLAAIIHSAAYTVFYFLGDPTGESYKLEMKETFLYMGTLATVAMSLIVFFSISWFRKAFYESFLLVHIVLSLMTIVALFYHTEIFIGEYDPYLWPPVAIWCFDRGLRFVRMAYCNLHVSFNKGNRVSHTRSSVSYDREGNMIRVQLVLQGSHLKPRPGQHYYLYQPRWGTGYENHPFTLAYWESPGSAPATAPAPAAPLSTDKSLAPQVHTTSEPSSNETVLEFWLRPYDGWTRRLRTACLRSPEPHTISPTILLEGPYGHSHPLWTYDTVLLVVGGSGITAAAPYLLDHATRKATRTKQITLLWTDRSEAFIRSVASDRLASSLALPGVQARFFTTGAAAASMAEGSSEGSEKEGDDTGTEKEASAKATNADVHVAAGRPDVAAAVVEAAREGSESGYRVAVLVCGPAGMADSARAAAYEARRRYGDTLDYIEEAFGW